MSELNEAVERYRHDNYITLSEESVYDAKMEDAAIIADAYLAEHDDTPVDEEGLRGCGFEDDPESEGWLTYRHCSHLKRLDGGTEKIEHWRIDASDDGEFILGTPNDDLIQLPFYKTIGQLRQLMNALGAEGGDAE